MRIPRAACDCHAHVFGPNERFAFIPDRAYTPAESLPRDYRAMLTSLGIERGVVVQPSVYGTDNGATLNAIAELGDGFRGVAVLTPDVDDSMLARCDAGGIRGVRLNDQTKGGVSLDHLEAMAARLRGSGWHIQLLTKLARHPDLAQRIGKLGVPVVFDHFGLPEPDRGVSDPGFQSLLALLGGGRCWVKLSGPYLSSKGGMPYADMEPFATALVAHAAGRLVWATDWPHPSCGDAPPDDDSLLALLETWAPDEDIRKKILVDNPIALYGLPPA